MYDRRYSGKVLSFEPSGGLLNAALVMRDRETDSWWSIITADAIEGDLRGTRLKELPVGEKIQWSEWKRRHPDTKVLSVAGREHVDRDPYGRYFSSRDGFRDLSTPDTRLEDKESIYAFQLKGVAYAVPHSVIEGGGAFDVANDKEIFLYRKKGAEIFASTFAYVSDKKAGESRFAKRDGRWSDVRTGNQFSDEEGLPPRWVDEGKDGKQSAEALQRLSGFDTFWYIWSATHPTVKILR